MFEEYIGCKVKVVIDRPLGSSHPKHGFLYELNYGYIPNTISGDGEELDAYVLGVTNPVDEFEGKVIAIIRRSNQDDDKLVVTFEDRDYSDDEIKKLTDFQEKWEVYNTRIIRNINN